MQDPYELAGQEALEKELLAEFLTDVNFMEALDDDNNADEAYA